MYLCGMNETEKEAIATTYAGSRIVMADILNERHRQNGKWGEQNHKPIEWLAILGEEVGEATKEALEHHFKYKGDQTERLMRLREELIQVSAVAVAMIESLDRNELNISQ